MPPRGKQPISTMQEMLLAILCDLLPVTNLDRQIVARLMAPDIREKVTKIVVGIINHPAWKLGYHTNPEAYSVNLCLTVIHALFRDHDIALINRDGKEKT